MQQAHSFHIPVMGIGFTIDTPLKVSKYGIDSVISLVDDILLERLRKMYCGRHKIPYAEISDKTEDFRAKRITSYLNLINQLAETKFEEFKNATIEKYNAVKEYFNLLPDSSTIKQEFKNLLSKKISFNEITEWLQNNLFMGHIDVNIMTKVDKVNYRNDEKLPVEYNDAQAALRGYANSDLRSSIIFSAGMHAGLYGYLANFADFHPDQNGTIKKKIVLKVSDYRSAFIQGRFLAKKGIWVSEYRVESGLNCGGHAFATDGYLLGPILAEFRDKRAELIQSMHELYVKALSAQKLLIPGAVLPLRITAQGGVGTAEEHQFLLDHYKLDSVGWGTPFLLVPEATNVDACTLTQLLAAKEADLYLSDISPLGVPFYSLRGNSKDVEKSSLIAQGHPGSLCPKQYVALNHEFTERSICPASRQYQSLKIKELEAQKLTDEKHKAAYAKIVGKSCICVGLGTSVLLTNDLDTKIEGSGVSVCPGPNMAYFSKIMRLKEIIDHIYGRANMLADADRPNMFVVELNIYIAFLKSKIEEMKVAATNKQAKNLAVFASNLKDGIGYYCDLFGNLKDRFTETKSDILEDLEKSREVLRLLNAEIEQLA